LDANGIEPKETVPASRKLGREDASEMAKAASKLIVSKGKKLSEWKAGDSVSEDAIDAMLGPTGNLRAPTLRVGKTILVGFSEETYAKALT
jgi:arsenate reductase-like glutaredoxin family protein